MKTGPSVKARDSATSRRSDFETPAAVAWGLVHATDRRVVRIGHSTNVAYAKRTANWDAFSAHRRHGDRSPTVSSVNRGFFLVENVARSLATVTVGYSTRWSFPLRAQTHETRLGDANWKTNVRSGAIARLSEGRKTRRRGNERRESVGIPDARPVRSARVRNRDKQRRRGWRRRGERTRWSSRRARVVHSRNEEDVIVVAQRNARNDGTLPGTKLPRRGTRLNWHETPTRGSPHSSTLGELLSLSPLHGRCRYRRCRRVLSPPARLLDPPHCSANATCNFSGRERRRLRQDATAAGGGSVPRCDRVRNPARKLGCARSNLPKIWEFRNFGETSSFPLKPRMRRRSRLLKILSRSSRILF